MKNIWKPAMGLVAAALAAALAGAASAQSYPTKPISIHTAGTGATADMVTRMLATELGNAFNQSVVVENKPAGPVLAMSVAKAPADGYTLLVWAGGLWLTPLLEPQAWDVSRDFTPIAALTRSPSILVVNPAVPAKTVAELIKLAKSQPGKLNYSSGQNGASSHLAGELFKSMAGVDIVRISYKGGPQESNDLLSGRVHMTFSDGTSATEQVKAGKLRALATTGLQRSVLSPDLPTVAETLPGFVSEAVYAFWAPAKTPDAIVKRLNQETDRALKVAQVRERLLNNQLEPVGGSPDQLRDLVSGQIARISKVLEAIPKQ